MMNKHVNQSNTQRKRYRMLNHELFKRELKSSNILFRFIDIWREKNPEKKAKNNRKKEKKITPNTACPY